ncbi:MAG: hypothetical protein ABI557_20660, partial [Aureliella sp.]
EIELMLLLGQFSESVWRAWLYLTHTRSLAIALGIGFAILAISLLVASRTRWGQAKPLTKCVVLSVLAHVWLLMYALGSRAVLPQGSPDGRETNMSVAFESEALHFLPQVPSLDESAQESESEPIPDTTEDDFTPQPWERTAALGELPRPDALRAALAKSELTPPALLPVTEPTPLPPLPPQETLAILPSDEPDPASPTVEPPAQTIDLAQDNRQQRPDQIANQATDSPSLPSVLPPTDMANSTALHTQPVSSEHSPIHRPENQLPADSQLPREYQLRQAVDRLQLAAAYGADQDSEAAVEAGLAWLAAAQSTDGSWNAKRFGAGTETQALGETRYGTGEKADTGVSGLALLAFLSAGHTHVQGRYQKTVERGLSYLLRAQWSTGDLSGPEQAGQERSVLYARMYCHGIATLALAEAYVMTRDLELRQPLMLAAKYSIKAQDTRGGGWRYSPGDSGDLSQFGWQAMALKSVQRSGIDVPAVVTQRMHSFLESCSTGSSKGLFTYRPKEGRPSETMTAEGLACRLMLEYPTSQAAEQEALKMIMNRRPGV